MMKITLAKKDDNDEKTEDIDPLELELEEAYKKETGKNPKYKRNGEWIKTKAFESFVNDYLDKKRGEVISNTANVKECAECGHLRPIIENGKCLLCLNGGNVIDYVKEYYADLTLTSEQIQRILLKETKKTEKELKDLLKFIMENSETSKRTALMLLADRWNVNLLDDKFYVTPKEIKESLKKRTLSVSTAKKTESNALLQKTERRGITIGLFGEHGTGKTRSAMSFYKYGKMLYLDGEDRAILTKNNVYPEADNIDIETFTVYDQMYRTDKLKTVTNFSSNLKRWIELIKKGSYRVVVIDKCDIFREYSKYEWLRRNPGRTKPQSYEWGEIEGIVQEMLLPFINLTREHDLIVILCYGMKDLYKNDTVIGTTENAKDWLLGKLDYEFILGRDYKKYCLKHPYRTYWEYADEGEDMSDYIFDKKHVDEKVTFKPYLDFKEEQLESTEKRKLRESKKISLMKNF